jgi:hypothetical protein
MTLQLKIGELAPAMTLYDPDSTRRLSPDKTKNYEH